MHNRIITFEQFCINVNETVARMLNVSVDSAIDIITDQRVDMEGEYEYQSVLLLSMIICNRYESDNNL